MNRREFLKSLGITGSVVASSGMNSTWANPLLAKSIEPQNENILVLLYLEGGNDGLNTIIPTKDYSKLSAARSNVLIPENRLLSTDEDFSFHPALQNLKDYYDNDELAVIHSVSYPQPNMSHFRSKEIVFTSSSSEEFVNTGWVGRTLHVDHPNFPDGYPNDLDSDPLVMSVGNNLSQVSQGPNANFRYASNNPGGSNSYALSEFPESTPEEGRFAEELEFLRNAQVQTKDYNNRVYEAYNNGTAVEETESTLEEDLLDVAHLIKGGLKSKIYIVRQGGYDTHGGQVVAGDPTIGNHNDLLTTLSNSLKKFQDKLEEYGLADKVATLVYTEFGRRIQSNESLGTDHGHACPWFLLGKKVNGISHGVAPSIPDVVDKKSNVEMQFDFRNIYASILQQWFGVSEANSGEIVGIEPEAVPLFKTDDISPIDSDKILKNMVGRVSPNPMVTHTSIPLNLQRANMVSIQVYDLKGRLMQQRRFGLLGKGYHELKLDRRNETTGRYILKVVSESFAESQSLVVQ